MSATTTIEQPSAAIKWDIVAGIAIIHLGALFAPFLFTWQAFWAFVWLNVATGLGVTLCYHRLLTHRSFQVPKWLAYTLTLFGVLALQGGPVKWVATHRVHHAFSDRPHDPHSPIKGFWWAHMLWLFSYDEVLDTREKFSRYAPELARDRFYATLDKFHVLPTVLLGFILLAIGGWPMVVWGLFLRTAVVYHGTWLVNSAAHLWGYQSYDTNEGSTNNWWVALVSYGEGWHNNHHAYLYSAAHGLRWWEVDVTYLAIRSLATVGLAKQVRMPQGNPARLPKVAPAYAGLKVRLPIPNFSTT